MKTRYSSEILERVVRMIFEQQGQYDSDLPGNFGFK